MSMGKKALMLGLCGAVLSAAVLLIEKKNREKKFEEKLWDAEEGDDAEIEFSMSAGDIDFEVRWRGARRVLRHLRLGSEVLSCGGFGRG